MAVKKLNFTKGNIDSLPLPESKLVMYHDTADKAIRGLVLRVFPSGVKSFSLFRRIDGKPENVTIGRYPQMTPEKARKEAERLNGEIAVNKNPAEDKRTIKAEMTLSELFKQYISLHAKNHKKTWKYDEWQFDKYLVTWKDRKLSSIHRGNVKTLHANIGTENGVYTANRVISLLTTLFNFARKMEYKGENPCANIQKFHEEKRDIFIQENELKKFFDALMKEPDYTARDAIRMMLFTGQRRSNVLCMRWEEINFDRAEWRISGEDMKNKETHVVPLVKIAMDILRTRYVKSESIWVFPSERRENHIKEPKGAWKRILDQAELPDLHFHDLRRTLASYMAITGAPLLTIAQMLGHKVASSSVTGIYARLSSEPVRQAMETAVRAMLRKGGMIPEEESVIEFKAAN